MKDPLKILFLSSRVPYPVRDGHTRRTYNILAGLSRTHNVHLLAMAEGGDQARAGRDHFRSVCAGFECLPAPSKRVSVGMVARLLRSFASPDPYTLWRHYSAQYRRRVRELLDTGSFDLVHCDILPLAYAITGHRSGVPVSLTDHDVCWLKAFRIAEKSTSVPYRMFAALEWRKLRRYEQEVFTRVSLGITVSGTDQLLLRQLCPGANLAVIENGVDTSLFTPGSGPANQHSIVWIGGFGYAPNRDAVHLFLDEIYPVIKREMPQASVTIVGADPTARIRQHAAADRSITLAGYVDDPVPFLQRAAVFVAPIGSGSGTRLKTLEAMAAGKGIVTTTIGCEGIEGVDKKHYLVADQPRDFAKSVVYLLKNRIWREHLGRNARELAVARYDWNSITEKMDGLYRELCGRKAQGQMRKAA